MGPSPELLEKIAKAEEKALARAKGGPSTPAAIPSYLQEALEPPKKTAVHKGRDARIGVATADAKPGDFVDVKLDLSHSIDHVQVFAQFLQRYLEHAIRAKHDDRFKVRVERSAHMFAIETTLMDKLTGMMYQHRLSDQFIKQIPNNVYHNEAKAYSDAIFDDFMKRIANSDHHRYSVDPYYG